MKILHVLYIFVLIHNTRSAEVYTSVGSLDSLMITKEAFINDIETYLSKSTEQITMLKRYLAHQVKAHKKAKEDINYLHNPINIYALMKRLTVDYFWAENKIYNEVEYTRNASVVYPDIDDLHGAMIAIGRLQSIYRLNVTELLNISQKPLSSDSPNIYSSNLRINDLYIIGLYLHRHGNYGEALQWAHLAHQQYYEGQTRDGEANLIAITKLIAESYFKLENWDYMANNVYRYVVGKDFTFSTTHIYDMKNTLKWFKKLYILNPNVATQNIIEWLAYDKRNTKNLQDYKEKYEQLCRNGATKDGLLKENRLKVSKRLSCHYLNKHPYLRLAPIKVETLHDDPQLMLAHEILSEEEMQQLKNQAKPLLRRSLVKGGGEVPNPRVGINSDKRISQSAWLPITGLVKRIYKRTSAFTALNTETAETLQITNYGLGGFYSLHLDYFSSLKYTQNLVLHRKFNERIGTVMFYLSDVEIGGATVFPHLDVAAHPVKGDALFWYNLQSSGVGDSETLHAACPVLMGDKWVANIWLHEDGQEFVRPCPTDWLNHHRDK